MCYVKWVPAVFKSPQRNRLSSYNFFFAFAASDTYKLGMQPGMMVHICSPSTWEAEAGELSGT